MKIVHVANFYGPNSGGIKTVETLIEMNPADLSKIPGIGITTAEQILKLLRETVELVEES